MFCFPSPNAAEYCSNNVLALACSVCNVVSEVPSATPVVDNLLVAGRCISTTRYVHQATKEIPAAMATGEAAGTAAARAANGSEAAGGTPPNVRKIDVAALRSDLSARGAIVGPGIRSKASRPSDR